MGLNNSKDHLLYQNAIHGNTESIRALRSEGAGLEWIDRDGKTPLIAACMSLELHNVAKSLIELGANVNAYRPGRHAGTPLHHAAERGLEPTVKALLSHGANALLMNGDFQTPLDVAREKGYRNIVRAIEGHICLFSGWLQELVVPGFIELLTPHRLCRKHWVVVLPCGSRNVSKPFKLEIAVYYNVKDAQPRMVIPLWKANVEEPDFDQYNPIVIVSNNSSTPRHWKRRRACLSSRQARRKDRCRDAQLKFLAANDSDKLQLQMFCDACKGIPQEMHLTPPVNSQSLAVTPTAPPMTIAEDDNPNAPPKGSSISNIPCVASSSISSSLFIADEIIDERREGSGASSSSSPSSSCSSCVICLDGPIEGACVPCGHMAGCISCLNEVKAKKWGCPVCRAEIDQVIRIYAV